ncbi:MAG: DUF2231 domain-containing protein [Candidatus Limnocylindria bacterium]
MESKTKLVGHPIHPMLIPFPLGLLSTALVFDAIHLLTRSRQPALVSFWTLAAGIVGGLLAAPFGLVDWLAVPPGTRAKRIGLLHGSGNLVVVALAALSWILRLGRPHQPSAAALAASAAGVSLAVVTGWLGGELVDRLGVGVDPGAHLNAPSSLTGKPAVGAVEPESAEPTPAS